MTGSETQQTNGDANLGDELVEPTVMAAPASRWAKWLRLNFVVGLTIVLFVIFTAILSFFWTPHDPTKTGSGAAFVPFNDDGFWFGTDQFGRDLFSQIMVGARTALFVGVLAVGIAILIGIPLGGLAAAKRGWTEEITMRFADVVYAFPPILLALLLFARMGPGTSSAMIAIGIAYVPIVARVTRGAALTTFELDYVAAARTYGRSTPYIFVRHVLPNIASVLIVQITVLFALAILAEAALSFLGVGTPPPTPTWGRSLRDSQTFLAIAPRLAIMPGLAIAVTVLGFNLLGDGIRDALDPRLEDRT